MLLYGKFPSNRIWSTFYWFLRKQAMSNDSKLCGAILLGGRSSGDVFSLALFRGILGERALHTTRCSGVKTRWFPAIRKNLLLRFRLAVGRISAKVLLSGVTVHGELEDKKGQKMEEKWTNRQVVRKSETRLIVKVFFIRSAWQKSILIRMTICFYNIK